MSSLPPRSQIYFSFHSMTVASAGRCKKHLPTVSRASLRFCQFSVFCFFITASSSAFSSPHWSLLTWVTLPLFALHFISKQNFDAIFKLIRHIWQKHSTVSSVKCNQTFLHLFMINLKFTLNKNWQSGENKGIHWDKKTKISSFSVSLPPPLKNLSRGCYVVSNHLNSNSFKFLWLENERTCI